MKAHDARNLGREDLVKRVEEMRAEYYTIEEGIRLGKERSHARLRHVRRDIARALTILRENK